MPPPRGAGGAVRWSLGHFQLRAPATASRWCRWARAAKEGTSRDPASGLPPRQRARTRVWPGPARRSCLAPPPPPSRRGGAKPSPRVPGDWASSPSQVSGSGGPGEPAGRGPEARRRDLGWGGDDGTAREPTTVKPRRPFNPSNFLPGFATPAAAHWLSHERTRPLSLPTGCCRHPSRAEAS